MLRCHALDDDDYTVILVAAPIYNGGGPVDLGADTAALATLHERIDQLNKRGLARSLKAAQRYGASALDGAVILHRALELLFSYNRLIRTLWLDGTMYLVTGERFFEQQNSEEYALMAALKESGVVEEPLPCPDSPSTDDLGESGDSRPIGAWIASLALETPAGQGLSEDRRTQLREWSHGGVELSSILALLAESET